MCRKVTSAMKMINSMFEAENMDSKELSAKAKMLLASYRHVCWASIGFFRVGSEEQYMICDDDIDQALNYLVEFSPSEDKRVFESNLKALFDSKWMMELVDDAMIQVKEFPDMGEMYFELLSKFYLSKFKYGENEMLEMLNMERSTYYDRKKEAILVFAWAMWGGVLNFLLNSGCRAATVRNIQNQDVDLSRKQIVLRHTKNGKVQVIPLCSAMVGILRDYMAVREGAASDYLFCNEFGDFLTENALRLAIVKYNNSRGVERTSIHAFRHTFARKYLVDCGGDAFSLQHIMGHSTLKMTRHYCNIFNDDIIENHEQRSPLAHLTQSKRQTIKK